MSDKETQECIDRETAEALERYRKTQAERTRVAQFFGCAVHKVVRGRDGAWTVR